MFSFCCHFFQYKCLDCAIPRNTVYEDLWGWAGQALQLAIRERRLKKVEGIRRRRAEAEVDRVTEHLRRAQERIEELEASLALQNDGEYVILFF